MRQGLLQRIRLIRWLPGFVMIGALLALLVGLKLRAMQTSQPAVAAVTTSDDANLTLEKFNYCDVREGCVRWTLRAASAEYFAKKQETALDQVIAVFFLKDGGRVELSGEKGILHNDNKNMEISGKVRLSYEDVYRLFTDRLLYECGEELISTPASVLVEGQGLMLKGVGMRLEIAERRLTVLKHIETKLQGITAFRRRG